MTASGRPLARPLPDPDDERTAAFWAATRQHRLVVPRCTACGYLRWPPAPLCPECRTWGGTWAQVRPTGILISFATYHRALDPAFVADVPYTVGLVQLDDGPRMYGTLIGDTAAPAIDGPVSAWFDPVSCAVTLVRWTVTAGPVARRGPAVTG